MVIPRLAALHRQLPDLQVRMRISDSFADLRTSEFDLAIFYLREPPPGLESTVLFDEICYPMCAPDYLAKMGPLDSAADLLRFTLLVQDDPQREWTGWREWFESQEVPGFFPRQCWRANNYPFLVQAAVQGDGILLGWEGLVQDQITRGELVPAWPGKLGAAGKCFLMTPKERYLKPVIRQVINALYQSR